MSNPSLSLSLFNQAVAKKREGKYAEAISLQQQSIAAYPDDPDIMQNYYSMGKTFYLAGNYDASFACYKVYNGLCVLKNPPILRDYLAMKRGDSIARQNLIGSFMNLAKHVGFAYRSSKENNTNRSELIWYRYTLMGQSPETISSLSGKRAACESYENECVDYGFSGIFAWFDEFVNNQETAKKKVFDLANALLNTR